MSQAPTDPTTPSPVNTQDDPLAHLHRMSTTAGISAEDYVAINPWSVAAGIFGIASVVALLAWPLLVFPLAGVICAAVAIWQIRRSNGTQTGVAYATIGLVLSLLFAVLSGGSEISTAARHRSDAEQISQLIDQMWQDLSQGQFAQAYDLHDDPFQQRVSQSEFELRWKAILNDTTTVTKIEWNKVRPRFEEGGPIRYAQAQVLIYVRDADGTEGVGRDVLTFRYVEGQWKISDFPMVFPPQRGQEVGI